MGEIAIMNNMTLALRNKQLEQAERMANLGHWAINIADNSLYWSKQIYAIHGLDYLSYTPTLNNAIDFYHPNDKDYVIQSVNNAINKGESFEFELRIIKQNGDIAHVRSCGECEIDEQGKTISVFGIFQDTTTETQRYDLAVKGASVGLWDWDISQDTLYWSPRFKEIIGINIENYEPSFTEFQQRLHPDDLDNVIAALDAHLHQGIDYKIDYRLRHNDGHFVWIHARGHAVWDHTGKATRMAGSIDDISIQKKNALHLQETVDFQKLLLNVNTDLIFVKDTNFNIIEANPAFLNLYPKNKRDSVIGTTTLEEYAPEQVNEFLQEDKKAFANGFSEVVESIDFPDGKQRTLLTKKIRFENTSGEPFILGIARDISDIKAAEDALIHANSELEEFAYRTSHDLRSPLISSIGILNILDQHVSANQDEKLTQYINIIRRSLTDLERLVTDILELTKAKNIDEESIPVDTSQLIHDSINKLSHMENFDRLTITTDLKYNAPFITKERRLRLIVENLLSNAIKYQDVMNHNSIIMIRTQPLNNHFVISVSDNGLGIPKKYHSKLFSMFKRFHPKTSYGSGLGLYMIKKSVQVLGGTIKLDHFFNNADNTTFTVTLPIINEHL